jgi:hypothetical protein
MINKVYGEVLAKERQITGEIFCGFCQSHQPVKNARKKNNGKTVRWICFNCVQKRKEAIRKINGV